MKNTLNKQKIEINQLKNIQTLKTIENHKKYKADIKDNIQSIKEKTKSNFSRIKTEFEESRIQHKMEYELKRERYTPHCNANECKDKSCSEQHIKTKTNINRNSSMLTPTPILNDD